MKYTIHISRVAFVLIFIIFTGVLTVFLPFQASAAVSGPCYICHTMHNSQNGTSVSMPDTEGANIGWDISGELDGGETSSTPAEKLLVTNCVGCHSSSTDNTIITMSGTNIKIPIVYNTQGPPPNSLAGGNFYWVGAGDDTKGHNVYGISGTDSNLTKAPGNKNCYSGSCHYTLAAPGTYQIGPTIEMPLGCQGCHIRTAHHDDTKPYYRFLAGHEGSDTLEDLTEYYVEGQEDDDWEQETSVDHNFYKGVDGPVLGDETLADTHSISSFCGGCHYKFHRQNGSSEIRIGVEDAWVRHPVDIDLPATGEFESYDPTTDYNLNSPVAWTTPTLGSKGTPIVMCLSCHRPHGSQYSDMLRWDYENDCFVDTGNTDCGCTNCHSAKR